MTKKVYLDKLDEMPDEELLDAFSRIVERKKNTEEKVEGGEENND